MDITLFSSKSPDDGAPSSATRSIREAFIDSADIYFRPVLAMAEHSDFSDFLVQSLRTNFVSSVTLFFSPIAVIFMDLYRSMKSLLIAPIHAFVAFETWLEKD